MTIEVRIPRPRSVLVRSPEPPVVGTARCVDVRPGRLAAFDGDRHRAPVLVASGGERRRLDAGDLATIEEAVEGHLRRAEPASATVRFGSRAACRAVASATTAAAIERRLAAAARRQGATFLTWTDAAPGAADYRAYDVVLD